MAGSYEVTAVSLGADRSASPPVSVTVVEGKRVQIGDLTIPQAASVVGRITDPAGNGVPACIRVTMTGPPGYAGNGCTDANGNYVIRSLAAGTYTGTVHPTDGAHLDTVLDGGASFTVVAGQSVTQDAVAPIGASIAFTLTDFRGNPAAHVHADIRTSGYQFVQGVDTDAAGHAGVTGLAAGDYLVDLLPDKFTTDAQEVDSIRVTVALAQTTPLVRQLPASDWVQGIVTNKVNGAPVAGIYVYANRINCSEGSRCFGHYGVTDASGHYLIHGLECDDYGYPVTFQVGVSSDGWSDAPNSGPVTFVATPAQGEIANFKLLHTRVA